MEDLMIDSILDSLKKLTKLSEKEFLCFLCPRLCLSFEIAKQYLVVNFKLGSTKRENRMYLEH